MNIIIINCHTSNRGDEAAIHALVDELNIVYPTSQITLFLRGYIKYPNMPANVYMKRQFIPGDFKSILACKSYILSRGKFKISATGRQFVEAIEKADIVLHAPGGPSIGDVYYDAEPTYLRLFDMLKVANIPYVFYAPSMGPFENSKRNKWRKKVLEGASAIILRDPISANYLRELDPNLKYYQTLDSALQHDIDIDVNYRKLVEYEELMYFMKTHSKCIGITITDLSWHPVWSKDDKIKNIISATFTDFIKKKANEGYGIVFIPQLYGKENDYDLMKKYCFNDKDFFIIPSDYDRYDTYFQQFLISKLHSMIGMRYHSNIFSAKMETPFISVSYEQKMQGFMDKIGLSEYCISVKDLSIYKLEEKFEYLLNNYDYYKKMLQNKHNYMKQEAYKTTKIVRELVEEKN